MLTERILTFLTKARTRLFPFQRQRLKLRFEVNQAEAFRHGVDCPRGTVTIKLDPATLTERQRRLIADRLVGIDLCEGIVRSDGSRGPAIWRQGQTYEDSSTRPVPSRLVASLPTVEALLTALEKDELRLQDQLKLRQSRIAKVQFGFAISARPGLDQPTHNVIPISAAWGDTVRSASVVPHK